MMPRKTAKQARRAQLRSVNTPAPNAREEHFEFITATPPETEAAERMGEAQDMAGTVPRKYESLQKFRRSNYYSTDYTENSYAI